MALRVCGTSTLFLLLSAHVASAQVRQISGRVTNVIFSTLPIPTAEVLARQ
jgi:hypothetical protein